MKQKSVNSLQIQFKVDPEQLVAAMKDPEGMDSLIQDSKLSKEELVHEMEKLSQLIKIQADEMDVV